jgi:hypothetical protein
MKRNDRTKKTKKVKAAENKSHAAKPVTQSKLAVALPTAWER